MTVTAYTDVQLCSIAMNMIGLPPINSIDNPSNDAESTCARLYPVVLRSLLAMHDWNFCQPVRSLAINADVTAQFGYTYAHKLPSDLVAGPFAVYGNNDMRRSVTDYQNANDHIHSNYESLAVLYRNNPAIDTWPSYFADLFVHALAARLAMPLTESASLATELRIATYGPADMDGRGGFFAQAKRIDAFSQPTRTLFQNGDPLTVTRF